MEEQKRHSGFETMRILSMVMIVLMHGIGHGGLGSAAPQGSAAFWIYWLLFILARVSTNCFVMLSGYYLSERKGAVRAGRLFRIGAQVWFYSTLTFCVAVRAGAVPLSAVKLLRALLPLTSNGYWFASAYFLLYLSVPVLNVVVQSLDRRQYKTLLLVALLLQSVWGTLFYWATDVTFVNNGYSFIWFYILYFMAAYFRKYRVTVPSGLCLVAYLAASAAGLFNRMLTLRVENALHVMGFSLVNAYKCLLYKNGTLQHGLHHTVISTIAEPADIQNCVAGSYTGIYPGSVVTNHAFARCFCPTSKASHTVRYPQG